jgi:amidase
MYRRNFMTGLLATPVVTQEGVASAQVESDDPLSYASVDDLMAMFRARKASPVDLLKAQIKRIEALNPKINCITYNHFDEALKEAQQSEDRYRRGDARPLEGITVAIKDEFNRPGWRTTQGSLILKGSPPATENSAVIDSLEAAGAVMPIQTTVPEFYLFMGASTRAWGTTHNPWNLEYSPWDRTWAARSAFPPRKMVSTALGRRSGGSRAGKSPCRPRARSRDASTTSSICRT